MDVFIFQASLYCDSCGRKIRESLDAKGEQPADVRDERTYDSDEYPKGPYQDAGGESDSFQHCESCETFLRNSLTTQGVSYAVEALQRWLDDSSGRPEVLDQWADELKKYSLSMTSKQYSTLLAYLKKREVSS